MMHVMNTPMSLFFFPDLFDFQFRSALLSLLKEEAPLSHVFFLQFHQTETTKGCNPRAPTHGTDIPAPWEKTTKPYHYPWDWYIYLYIHVYSWFFVVNEDFKYTSPMDPIGKHLHTRNCLDCMFGLRGCESHPTLLKWSGFPLDPCSGLPWRCGVFFSDKITKGLLTWRGITAWFRTWVSVPRC